MKANVFTGIVFIFCHHTRIRMKNILLMASALFLTSCVTREMSGSSASPASFDKFLDGYYEEYLKLNPLEATQIADNRYNDLLPNDISGGYRRELEDF